MKPRIQGKRETVRIKKRLLERGQTITALAPSLGYARNTVSMAINHPDKFPAVLAEVRKELGL